jgi:hypothetical protein
MLARFVVKSPWANFRSSKVILPGPARYRACGPLYSILNLTLAHCEVKYGVG